MPVDGTRQPCSVLTQEQQLEIDRQIAYRLQEIKVAQAYMKDHTPKTQENSSQYNQNDVSIHVLQKQKRKQEKRKPTHVGFPHHQLSRQQ